MQCINITFISFNSIQYKTFEHHRLTESKTLTSTYEIGEAENRQTK